jgi:opacity protein-like surface antigen
MFVTFKHLREERKMKKLLSLCALFALSAIMALAADVTGTWKGEAPANGKGGPPSFTFKQAGSALTGTSSVRGADVEISNGKVDGDKISFEVSFDAGDKGKMTNKYSGTVSGTTMKLSAETARGTREVTLTKQ